MEFDTRRSIEEKKSAYNHPAEQREKSRTDREKEEYRVCVSVCVAQRKREHEKVAVEKGRCIQFGQKCFCARKQNVTIISNRFVYFTRHREK